jgi:serine/threonine protein kinase
MVSRFEREMLILSKLDHPNIVQYYGGGKHEGRLFYAMEAVPGGTMTQMLQTHGKLTWQETIRYGIQISSALQHAHNHGIVHRDIKPSNLFMTYQGDIKLGDFGIALDRGESDLTQSGMTVGSWLYMAPEQIRGASGITGLTDLYALGCLLYELLTGRPPFTGEHFAEIFDQHLRDDPQPLENLAPDCPKSLREIIEQLLHKDPYQRPHNARAVQGVMSELKLDWAEDETRYQLELNRLQLAFDSSSAAVQENSRDIPFKQLLPWLLLAIAAAVIATLLSTP